MDQSDLNLLQTVPSYHLQAVMRVRHIPLSPLVLGNNLNLTANTSSSASASPLATSAVAEEIGQYLFESQGIEQILQELGSAQWLILAELVACGGRANSRDLALYFSLSGQLHAPKRADTSADQRPFQSGSLLLPPQYPPAHPHGPFEEALRHLLALGLVFWGKQTNFAGREYSSGTHDGVLIVPQAVRTTVHAYQQQQASETKVHEKSEQIPESFWRAQRLLYLYWSLVASRNEGLALVNNGLLGRTALRLIIEQLAEKEQQKSSFDTDPIRSEIHLPRFLFIRQLLMQLGLLYERQGTLYAASAPAESFFALSINERVRRCYQLYAETTFWNELGFLPDVIVRPGPEPLEPAHNEVLNNRQQVLERILSEQTNEKVNIAAFIARTKLYYPYLLFPRHYGARAERYSSASNPYGWDFRLRRGWLTHREGWHMVEGSFIRAIVTGPLQWLGLVDCEQEDGLQVFTFSPDALWIMGHDQLVGPEIPWGRLIVQPNFELVVLAPVSEALLVRLDRFAERISLEHVAQYRLTKASVTRAIQHGLSADSIQQILTEAAGDEIPQNIHYSVGEWERQARRVELWPQMTLLEVADPALLDELLADEETRKLFGRRLSERQVEIPLAQRTAVQQLFWRRNYLPAQTDVAERSDSDARREPQWRLHVDGLLEPLYPVLDLYLVAEVGQFTTRDEATGWPLVSAHSVQQALEQGKSLEQMQHFLQSYCEAGIPGSLMIRLKLWGRGYAEQSQIRVERAPLLHLSAEILQDLQADNELNELLGSQVETTGRLVHVAEQNLERVLDLLRERGFLL
ncbi:helicase-associated domain-containing protein [Tengunoibacter tsumagoiensis]|uniref:Helicase XPB/Ssl2 N-terminal domain-containing protein n=1 Tax=Tengunoibacter tsumagoiensis TaxID=2014871 RepID=A0A402A4T8_9CHLR|nr:helicase-associated domain-containing protein [Tengunoibacter tsumagoiensis]GCE14076.1 hypothetical protein KTT_39350 [Tengunoibacter tsumagoiensis]